jgi:hypothetical protein
VEFTFDHHDRNVDFVRIVSIENIHNAEYVKRSDAIKAMNNTILDSLGEILRRGAEEGLFRKGLVPLDVHLLISSFCFYRVSNRHTFGEIFQIDLPDEGIKQRHREMICESVCATCRPETVASKLARHRKPSAIHALKVRQHSLGIGHHAAEQFERLHRLKHRHVAAIQGPAAQGAGVAQQFGFQREVNNLRDPQLRAQQSTGTGMPGSFHAHGCGVHQAVGLGQAPARSRPATARPLPKC